MSRRILVADDSSTIQKVIKIAFARHNVEIVEASSFIEALATAVRQGPDLLIVDASLPGAKGPEDFTKLARDANGAPVLLLFGTYDAVDEALFRQAGFPHFLKKPFESGDLLALADRLLGGDLTRDAQAPGRDVPTMPPSPDQPRPAGRLAHTAVIYEPGTFQLGEGQDPTAPPPGMGRHPPSRQTPPPPARPTPSIPDLDLDDAAPAPDDGPSPRVLTDETQRGRRAFVPEPPIGTIPPRAPGARGASPVPLPPAPTDRGGSGGVDDSDLEAELERLGVPPPTPQAGARSTRYDEPRATVPPPGPIRNAPRPLPNVPADLGRAPDMGAASGRVPTVPPSSPRGRGGGIDDDELLALLDERLPALARQAIEDYCERHFKSLAREIIAAELRRLADEKARHLVDN